VDSTAPVTSPVTGRTRRVLEVVALVAVWMALGWLLGVDPNGYLLLGIPLTLAFQLLVRRRPVRELWVRDGDRFALDRVAVLVAVLLMVVPAVMLVRAPWPPGTRCAGPRPGGCCAPPRCRPGSRCW
jgi:hypothetical protein